MLKLVNSLESDSLVWIMAKGTVKKYKDTPYPPVHEITLYLTSWCCEISMCAFTCEKKLQYPLVTIPYLFISFVLL